MGHDVSNSPIRFPLGQRLRAAKQSLAAVDSDAAARAIRSALPGHGGRVGEALETRRAELVRGGGELNRIPVDPRTNSFVGQQLPPLQPPTSRIAIIRHV